MAELAELGRGCVHGRRAAGRLRRAHAARAAVQRADRPPPRAPLRGAVALARRPRARRRRLGGARDRPVPVDSRERDGRARPVARRLRGPPAPPDAPLGARVGRRARPRARERRRRDRGGHAAPPRPHRRGGAVARHEHEDEPAAAGRGRPRGAARRAQAGCDLVRRDRPRAARPPGEGRAVRGGAVRGHRARDGVRRALHVPRRSGSAHARDAPRAHVDRACARVRPRRAADRGRRAREPRRARPRRRVDGRRRRLPLALRELVAPRGDAARAGREDDRRRPAGRTRNDLRAISCSRTERSFAAARSRPTASRSARPCSRPA